MSGLAEFSVVMVHKDSKKDATRRYRAKRFAGSGFFGLASGVFEWSENVFRKLRAGFAAPPPMQSDAGPVTYRRGLRIRPLSAGFRTARPSYRIFGTPGHPGVCQTLFLKILRQHAPCVHAQKDADEIRMIITEVLRNPRRKPQNPPALKRQGTIAVDFRTS